MFPNNETINFIIPIERKPVFFSVIWHDVLDIERGGKLSEKKLDI